ncbi:MAG: D-glucuronyl C5-epimerase family protein [Candidatus Limnocylindrales bacterium]
MPIITRKGVVVTHPENLAAVGLALLDSHAQTGSRTYLDQARAIAKRLSSIGIASRGGLYLPYSFDFALHGRADDIMRTPWPSAMAQGEALSLFIRLHMATGDDTYLAVARRLFATLADPGVRAGPWVSRVDARRYLWLEEYPAPIPDQTLNGFLFAIFGLYDYDQAVHAADSAALLDGAVTTVKHYLPAFRHPHGLSYYCLAHHVQSVHYHHVVIKQLHQLAGLTGDVAFATASNQFKADHA